MMYKHGIYISETPTSITPPTRAIAGLPVVIGTAPINLSTQGYKVNEPVLCYSFDDAVKAFGFSKDFANYTLCEFIKSHFVLFGMSPAVLINVLDPAIHKTDVSNENINLISDLGTITSTGVLIDTVIVKSSDGSTTYQKDLDYTLAFNEDGELVLTRKKDGNIPQATTSLRVSYSKLDASKVTANDVVGGIDIETGKATGLELINQVFPKFGLVPGLILAPYWSTKPEVAAVMDIKSQNINGHFKCMSIVDVPTDVVTKYTDVPTWKNNNKCVGKNQIVCWPMLQLNDEVYHMSTQLAGVICKTDSENEGVPYVSPSNRNLNVSSTILKDGLETYLGPDQAAYLNGEGIVTALNFVGGWKAWGNRTGKYQASDENDKIIDPKDVFIPLRRMFNWIGNTLMIKFWERLDYPLNKRLIESIVDSSNLWLNGLTARQYILGGRVAFLKEENAENDLMNGIIKFHVYVTPPSPAREIDFILEYDTNYIKSLLG